MRHRFLRVDACGVLTGHAVISLTTHYLLLFLLLEVSLRYKRGRELGRIDGQGRPAPRGPGKWRGFRFDIHSALHCGERGIHPLVENFC